MHEVDQDVVVNYALVKIVCDVFDSYKSLWGFLRVLRVFRVFEGFWGFLKVFGFFYGFLSYLPRILVNFHF